MGARRKSSAKPRPASAAGVSRTRTWLIQHRTVLVDSLRRLGRRPINSLLTLGVIAVALALPAALYTGIKNLSSLGEDWQSLGDLSVYLSGQADADTAQAVADRLLRRPDVLQVRPVSPAQGLALMEDVAGMGEAVSALPDNPLPWVMVVRPQPAEPAAMAVMAEQIEAWPEVASARFDLAWLERFTRLLELGRLVAGLVATLLGGALVLVVGNTIRLDIENRRREVEVVRLLGATDGFIRRPFLYAGLWYGLGGALAALAVVQALTALLQNPVARLADAYNSNFTLSGLDTAEALGLVALGALIGWLGSWLAVSRQLAGIQPE